MFPLVLPMGWVESPHYFYEVTETVADLDNKALKFRPPLLQQSHRLDAVSNSQAPVLDNLSGSHLDINKNHVVEFKCALAYIDIFVDSFLGVTQGSTENKREVDPTLLQLLDNVLRHLSPYDPPVRQDLV